jgi:hypothetical protein
MLPFTTEAVKIGLRQLAENRQKFSAFTVKE